ncbi:hypothetical protein CU098_007033 [Rhizopus stolonifer]|uniref:Uncharacterized protein n=1 Tax=Rhizopus stolonifer TaxID=4846 RepID=A0A367KM04_RHIST|nr:hypothetical protein CU098_007033 [Rhizopus stolonifer]
MRLLEAVTDSVSQLIQPKNTLHMACYDSALTNYRANLASMRDENKMINILLNKLVSVLLCVHLVPKRKRKRKHTSSLCMNLKKARRKKKPMKQAGPFIDNGSLIISSNNLNAADVKAKWAKRVNNSERPIQTYKNAIIKKKGETVAKKRKQSVEAQMLEGFKRPCTNVPYEAGPSRQQITMMEVEEGKGKALMRTQTIPKPVVFRTPATEAKNVIPPSGRDAPLAEIKYLFRVRVIAKI